MAPKQAAASSGAASSNDASSGRASSSEPSPDVRSADAHGRPARPVLILGSASPRRRDLLAQIGVAPDAVLPADIDETPRPGEPPRAYVLRMALEKAAASAAAAPRSEPALILTADTVVAVGRRILGKPEDARAAAASLALLSGRRHQVMTAIALLSFAGADAPPEPPRTRIVQTMVRMRRLSERQIGDYLASGEWRGKAGGYAIQGRAAAFVPALNGSYTNVVGLPLAEAAALLNGAGFPVWTGAAEEPN